MTDTLPKITLAFFAVLAAVAIGLALAWPMDAGLRVTRNELGAAWPLMVDDGILRCEPGREITFQRDGTTYTLNRRAEHGAHSDITPLRAGDKDLTPLIERGLRLCP